MVTFPRRLLKAIETTAMATIRTIPATVPPIIAVVLSEVSPVEVVYSSRVSGFRTLSLTER